MASDDKYYVITSSEDGISIQELDDADLLKAITPDKYGGTELGEKLKFLAALPSLDKPVLQGGEKGAAVRAA